MSHAFGFAVQLVASIVLTQESSTAAGFVGLPELASIAILLVGGANRTESAHAAEETWFSMFPNRLHVTDESPDPVKLGASLAAVTLNVFEGIPADEKSLLSAFLHTKHPFWKQRSWSGDGKKNHMNRRHNAGWQIAQAKYLLGLQALVLRFPAAEWYFVADSDTFVFPRRLIRGLLRPYEGRKRSIALGFVMKFESRRHKVILGGSGTAISAAAIAALSLQTCIDRQVSDIKWNKLPSDWRLSGCLEEAGVEIKSADFMYMVNDRFDCTPHGPDGCEKFYGRQHRRRTECPYTLHYMAPDAIRNVFYRGGVGVAKGVVCLPDKVGICNCTQSIRR